LNCSDARSPTVLEAQAFGEVAAEFVLPEVHQLALQIPPMSRQRWQNA
jgi:hypothetical protein